MIKVVNPSVEIWRQEGYTLDAIWKHIARCARVCYQSTPKNNGETDYGFVVRTLLKRKDVVNQPYNIEDIKGCHLSVFEHGIVHLKLPLTLAQGIMQSRRFIKNYYNRIKIYGDYCYVTTNMRVIIENAWIDTLEFIDNTNDCPYYKATATISFTTDIGVSRELNRHRCHSISEESTRYCAYDKCKFGNGITVAKCPWILEIDPEDKGHNYREGFFNDNEIFHDNIIEEQYTDNWTAVDWFFYGLQICDLVYRKTREHGWTAQQAREILPLNTKTQVVHTAYLNDWYQWCLIRADEVSGKVHPCMKFIANRVKEIITDKSCG